MAEQDKSLKPALRQELLAQVLRDNQITPPSTPLIPEQEAYIMAQCPATHENLVQNRANHLSHTWSGAAMALPLIGGVVGGITGTVIGPLGTGSGVILGAGAGAAAGLVAAPVAGVAGHIVGKHTAPEGVEPKDSCIVEAYEEVKHLPKIKSTLQR